MTTLADPIEQRDFWRSLWQFLTSDAVMIALCFIVAVGAIAALALPQSPAAGTADPVAYSRWEADAKLREGALFEPLFALGLSSVAQTAWWRIALVALATVTALRLTDRVSRLVAARTLAHAGAVRDEPRIRVMLDAPPLDGMAMALRQQRYRVAQPGEDVLTADRSPWAEALSIVMHAGLLIVIAGLLMNVLLGWEAINRAVVAGVPTLIHPEHEVTLAGDGDDGATMQLVVQPADAQMTLAPGQVASVNGIAIALRQITPGYRLSATTADNQPVLIRASNFVSPTTEVLLTFSEGEPERYVAVPDAGVALALSPGASLDQPGAVRVIAISSGSVITETAIAPQLTVDGTTFQFTPARGAVIDARSSPGDPLVWTGLGLGLIGLIGALAWPMRRIVVRHRGHWTEVYASGRGVRRAVNRLLT
jgi:cytochrome c biogenesis protein ResB